MDPELRIRELLDQSALHDAATLAIEIYGAELYGLLAMLLRDPAEADDVFGQTCADMWSGIGQYSGLGSFRGWAYTVARHAFHRYLRQPYRRRRQRLSLAPQLSGLVERVRTTTRPYLRTGVKDRVRALRERLTPDEQLLLTLRVDRNLPWHEVAQVLEISAGTCRKRYQRLVERLRGLAEAEGLLEEPEA